MSIVKLVQGDTGPLIPLYVTNTATGAAVDLTGMVSSRLLFRAQGSTTTLTTVTLSNVDLANGVLGLTPTSAMTTNAGTFEGEVEITMPGSVIVTGYEIIQFFIRAQFT